MRWLMAIMLASGVTLVQAEAATDDPMLDKGAAIFENCMACHGERAMGDEDNEAPRLAGQHAWYLVTQLENFRAGVRGMHEDDDNGQMMQAMASGLSDEDIEAVVAYIATLGSE